MDSKKDTLKADMFGKGQSFADRLLRVGGPSKKKCASYAEQVADIDGPTPWVDYIPSLCVCVCVCLPILESSWPNPNKTNFTLSKGSNYGAATKPPSSGKCDTDSSINHGNSIKEDNFRLEGELEGLGHCWS